MKQKILPFEKMQYKDCQVCIDDTSIQYVQTVDCTENQEECQVLIISTRNNGISRFINIKTDENGWSIDKIDDLIEIIKDFKKRAFLENE